MTGLNRFLAPLVRRVRTMILQAAVNLTADDNGIQSLQVGVLAGETLDRVTRLQNYGFTGRPHAGAQALLLSVGGVRSHSVAVVVEDKRYRKKGLQTGEIAMYTDEGDYILMKRGRIVEVVAGAKLTVNAPVVEVTASDHVLYTTPEFTITGNLNVGGGIFGHGATGATIDGPLLSNTSTSDLNGSMQEMRDVHNIHDHNNVQPGAGNSGKPNQLMT